MNTPPVEIVNTEKMLFDALTITGDYSDHDFLEEEQEIIYLNDIAWVKLNKVI